jgi:O-antigen/teichoic acid export membrane protein
VLAAIFWSKLGISPRVARLRFDIVRRVWRLAAGIGATATLGAILMQTDKIIVSKLLTLDHFGYYMLAAIVASSVGRVATPIFMTIYPRFSQLVAEMNHVALASLYHKTTQLLSFLMLPATVVLALLPEQVLYVWTQDAEVAKQSRLILSILVVGTALNGMMHIPYALQLGYGYARLALYSNMIAIAVLVPLVSFLATRFGAAGAASGWLILNAGYFLISVQIMHRRLLPSEKGAWYLDDILKPLLPTLAVVLVARYLAPSQSTVWATALFVVTSTLAAYFASACATREVRRRILQSLKALPRSATRT